ncbi:hypothetical protein RDI58_020906 [Solanum bulbocastanum]
MKPG